ncbi:MULTISPECIES: GNAT family N-acetyltransferase [unclassified Moraxella]|uniref:GNAT family N-acetyltransferase n=1 Tax=unclassified Moraxella TaxID=2685852 RepID=UPI003AF426F4
MGSNLSFDMSHKALSIPSDFSLSLAGIRLELLTLTHEADLIMACQDGKLWELPYTSTPTVEGVHDYILKAHSMSDRVAFAVIDEASGKAIGTTSFHDILPAPKRLEIGYTWYAQSHWRSHVNTACKLMLLTYAFETLHYQTIGWRTDILNTRSQQAIERLGAKKDGTIRGNRLNKDGMISDTMMYSMSAEVWQTIKPNLTKKLG